MKKKTVLCMALILINFSMALPTFGFGAVVFDPAVCARLAEEAVQLKRQMELLKEQLASIKHLNPNQYQWSSTQGLMNKLNSSIDEAQGLSYSATFLNQKFKEYYPGSKGTPNYDAQHEALTSTTLNTLSGVLSSLSQSANNFDAENKRLLFLQTQEKGALGQTQAIQAASQIASEQVSQLQLLRQSILAQTTAQTAFFAKNVQEEASQRAEFKKVLLSGQTHSAPIGYSGHTIDLNQGRPE